MSVDLPGVPALHIKSRYIVVCFLVMEHVKDIILRVPGRGDLKRLGVCGCGGMCSKGLGGRLDCMIGQGWRL